MKSRFLAGSLLITLLAVVALGVPLALVARHQVFTSSRENLRHDAASIAAGLEDRLDAGRTPDLTRYRVVLAGRRLIVTDATGRQSTSGPALTGPVEQASVNVGAVTVTIESYRGPAALRAREVTLLVLALALLAVSAAVLLSLTQARRLSAPLARLAARADALGHGQFAPAPVRSGIVEIDQISDELERSATQIATMMSLQREFASDAAHQLRTPLTGIGLRLEELSGLGDCEVRAEAEQALVQVERLEAVIGSLLARARGDAADPEWLDIGGFLDEELPNWRRLFDDAGRGIVVHSGLELSVRVRRGHLASILTCLLDNALHHGAGDVQIRARGRGTVAEIALSDAGAGVPTAILGNIFDRRFSGGNGSGIGLALARSLAEAEAGSLRYEPGHPPAFILTLPTEHRRWSAVAPRCL